MSRLFKNPGKLRSEAHVVKGKKDVIFIASEFSSSPMARHLCEYSDSLVKSAVAKGKITPDDADLLLEFLKEQIVEGNSPRSCYNVFYNLVALRQYLGEYRHNTERELFDGLMKFKESGRKQATIINYLLPLRQFYLWLVDKGYSTISRDKLEHKIKIKNPDRMEVTPESDLTQDEIIQLIRSCKNSRDRAFVALLYDAGLKTKKACTLTRGRCKFDEYGLYLIVRGKTKVMQYIRCDMAADYLTAWRNEYPGDPNEENPIFVTRMGNPFTRESALRSLGKIVKESGITKPVHLHSLKHS